MLCRKVDELLRAGRRQAARRPSATRRPPSHPPLMSRFVARSRRAGPYHGEPGSGSGQFDSPNELEMITPEWHRRRGPREPGWVAPTPPRVTAQTARARAVRGTTPARAVLDRAVVLPEIDVRKCSLAHRPQHPRPVVSGCSRGAREDVGLRIDGSQACSAVARQPAVFLTALSLAGFGLRSPAVLRTLLTVPVLRRGRGSGRRCCRGGGGRFWMRWA